MVHDDGADLVPTYPEDGSRALKVYQHQHHGCAGRPLGASLSSELREQLYLYYISRLRRPIRLGIGLSAGTFTVRQRAARSILP
jgi:hypothetical protein